MAYMLTLQIAYYTNSSNLSSLLLHVSVYSHKQPCVERWL